MATTQTWMPNTSKQMDNEMDWSDEAKQEWFAAHGGAPTHVVTFEPLYQIELCIPPWEQPDRHIARSAVAWGQNMQRVLASQDPFADPFATSVVAAHHEGNSMEVYSNVEARPRPRLRAVN
jgi:hypothetical protein